MEWQFYASKEIVKRLKMKKITKIWKKKPMNVLPWLDQQKNDQNPLLKPLSEAEQIHLSIYGEILETQ